MTSTILVLGLYFVIAFLPKVPWYVKVGLQLIIGAVIYFGFPETEFSFPDDFVFQSLIGGNPEWLGESFNKLAMGVVGTAFGLICTVVATIIYAIFGKKTESEDSTEEE